MTQRRTTPIVAGFSLILATAPLVVIFKGLFEWFGPMLLTVAVIVGAAQGMRALRRGTLIQSLAMLTAFLLVTTLLFRSGGEYLGFLPSPATFAHFARLAQLAGTDVSDQAIPVDATDGLVFLLVTCIGALAIITDLIVSTFNSAAVVGLPLLTLYVAAVAISPVGVPWLLFIPGAVGYVWLLMTDNVERVRRYGRRFSGDGRGIDRWEPSPLATTGRWLALIAIPVALIIPSLLPGMDSGLLAMFYNSGGPGGSGDGPGGNPSRVDPVAALQGALDAGATTEMGTVTTDNPNPGNMKMWVASTLTEQGFQASITPSANAGPIGEGIPPPTVAENVESMEWTATFTASGLADYALPLYGYPTQIEAEGDWVYDPLTGTVSSVSRSTAGLSFTYTYVDYEYTVEQLRAAAELSDLSQIYRDNTSVPDNPYVADLVEELTAGLTSPYDKVMAIHDHFSRDNGFSYELSTEDGWSGSAIVDFLENKSGFCQQYAGAMAWMVRQADIPARVAIGMTRGNVVREGFRVTNFNFHSWVEVYFDGLGWVPFDPTPASSVRTPTEYEWAPDPDRAGNSTPGENPNDPANPDDPDAETGPQDESDPNGQAAQAITFDAYIPPPTWPMWVAVGMAGVGVLLIPAAARSQRRRRRLSVSPDQPQDATDNAWRELTDTVIDLGIPLDPSRSPRATAAHLVEAANLTDTPRAAVEHLAAAEERSRYAPRPPTGMTLPLAYRVARVGLYRSVKPLARLRADLAPVTLLSSWRRGVRSAVEAVSLGMIRLRLLLTRRHRRSDLAGPTP
ncbi:uncharacterized protein DUF4129 [Stackebrandtia endophytica]|uniref:Uncharacterized protein DUF4129 n=1 Tax=Stackebrandtia endophytica TaxID=1496996 RepID=A0A543ASC1_9ACTN|nr:transglutaminaseTgpA domain-containing protein [Stackebrandtia endophytica]TQL75481.1 uncharacterized protein DUF4129 [Stackebrandtia endophytica]